MQYILDTNLLKDPITRVFLKESPGNKVVLTDYLGMEAHQCGSPTRFAKQMRFLAEHPKQVVVLKGTAEICKLVGAQSGASQALVDPQATSNFPEFCTQIADPGRYTVAINEQLESMGRSAAQQLGAMSAAFSDLFEDIGQVVRDLPIEGVRQLRRGDPLSEPMGLRMRAHIMEMTTSFFDAHGVTNPGSRVADYGHRFPFRFAVAAYTRILRWIAKGTVGRGAEKLRNDIVDSTLVAYATYFDGVLSKDSELNSLSIEVEEMLKKLFGVPVGPM